MPTGILINCSAVLSGGLIGAIIGKKIPESVKNVLPLIFGLSAMSIGITLIIKVKNLSAVVLALILGTIIGTLIRIGDRVEQGAGNVNKRLQKNPEGSLQGSEMSLFVSGLVLFCFSGTGIFGALTEGMTGEYTILIIKSILDFFTAMIFASSVGFLISLISIPQFLIYITLFLIAQVILPLTNPDMIADFTACGGIIAFAVGFNILKIKDLPVLNFLPALLLVMPISYLWALVF
ncbi:MAG: DUF554 domain-containing protein [Anaerolineaceae bacterium]